MHIHLFENLAIGVVEGRRHRRREVEVQPRFAGLEAFSDLGSAAVAGGAGVDRTGRGAVWCGWRLDVV